MGGEGNNSGNERARIRFSFDAGTMPAEHDTIFRLAWDIMGGGGLFAGQNLFLRCQTGSVPR